MSSQILVTGPSLDEEAVRYLQQHQVQPTYLPAYATTDNLIQKVKEIDPVAIISRMGRIDAPVFEAAKSLKLIVKHGVGVDNIDIDAASAHGIPVAVAYGANAQSVAEHTLALLLAVTKKIVPLDKSIRAGRWEKPGFQGYELAGSRLALIGFGAIARETARFAQAFGLQTIAYDPYAQDHFFEASNTRRASTVEECLSNADIVSLHCPLLAQTRHLINAQSLASMKPGAFLINTARGALIDEAALLQALKNGQIAGAGLDTFESEPPAADHPFWSMDNVVLTPHIGGVTVQASRRVAMMAAQAVVAMLNQTALPEEHIVNRAALAARKEALAH